MDRKITILSFVLSLFTVNAQAYFVLEPNQNDSIITSVEHIPAATQIDSKLALSVDNIENPPTTLTTPSGKDELEQALLEMSVQQQSLTETTSSFCLVQGSLKKQFENYASSHGYTFIWNAPKDYLMQGAVTFNGDLMSVLSQLFQGLNANNIMLKVKVYEPNKTIEVIGN